MAPVRTHSPGRDAGRDRQRDWGQIQVEMTSRCNLRCTTCLYPAYAEQWISRDLSPGVFEKLRAVASRADAIHLQGWGETLLRPDTPLCVAALRRAGTRPTLSSNGCTLSAATAGELIENGLHSMTFSLAGPDAASHDSLRGPGTFAATLGSIRTFAARRSATGRPPLLVNYLLTPYSFPRLPQALALCSRLGVDTLVATHLVHVCTAAQEALACYGAGRGWLLFRSRLAVLWRRTGLVLPGNKPSPLPVCVKNPLANLFVAADGAVSPCVYLCPPVRGDYTRLVDGRPVPQRRLVMGSLEHQDLAAVWNRPAYRRFRALFRRRLDLYESVMPALQTDLEGQQRLEQAVDRIRTAFASPAYHPPAPCRGCPHLQGY